MLYLFRRNTRGGAGAGKYRGGTGGESALTLHDAPEGKIKGVALGVAGPEKFRPGTVRWLSGSAEFALLKEGTRVEEMIAEDKSPDQLDDVGGEQPIIALL